MTIIKKEVNNISEAFVALGEGWNVLLHPSLKDDFKSHSYRIIDGVFYINGREVSNSPNYMFCGKDDSFPTIAWKEQPWYENIPSKGVWCKISNGALVLIKSSGYNTENAERYFIDSFGEEYYEVDPISKEEMMEYFD